MTRARLLHRTAYTYARPVQLGPQLLRLRPLPDPRVPVPGYALHIEPPPLTLNWHTDPLGNQVARFALAAPVSALLIEITLDLDLTPRNPFDFVLDPDAATWPFRYAPEDAGPLAPALDPGVAGQRLQSLRDETAGSADTVTLLTMLGARVRDRLAYVVRMEPGVWSAEQTLQEQRGSCRDFAWLLVQLLRLHGIAARFVSGYLLQIGENEPASAELHAWAEAYLPGAGWIGIDATSGYLTAQSHVALAASPEPLGAAPLTGTSEPAESRLDTHIAVQLIP